jgi:hypothetical protein
LSFVYGSLACRRPGLFLYFLSSAHFRGRLVFGPERGGTNHIVYLRAAKKIVKRTNTEMTANGALEAEPYDKKPPRQFVLAAFFIRVLISFRSVWI